MRATMRITWLLLSLSFLFHSVCSTNSTSDPYVNATNGIISTSGTEPTNLNMVQTEKNTGATPTGDSGQTTLRMLTPEQTTTAVSTKMTTAATLAVTTQPQVTRQPPAVTNNLPAPTASTTVAPPVKVTATFVAVKSSLVKATPPAATSGSSSSSGSSSGSSSSSSSSSGSSGSTTNAATTTTTTTTQAPEISSPSDTSKTEPTPTPGPVDTIKTTEDVTKADQQPMLSTTVTPKGTVGVIGTFPSHKLTTITSIPEPTGNTGTTGTNPSTLNSADRPTAARTTAGTTSLQTTTTTTSSASTSRSTTTTAPQPKTFLYSLNNGQEKGEEKHLVELCRRLMGNLQDGNCSLTWREHNHKVQFDNVEINGKVKTALAAQYYEEITKTPTDNKTLIAILASCGALLIMIVILAVCASHHRKPYHENQQHLTEELHTVENGYHDNPTLEVMEVQPEMQEKKVALNGEFNDSWIVPIDNLLKEDIPDEEDTHL
ncbi:hypothetical protein PAMA_012994 [Pampus argenteus]